VERCGDSRARRRTGVAVITGMAVLGYFVLVYLIFFRLYAIDTDHVRGVQGHYFAIGFPVAAVFIAALIKLTASCHVACPQRLRSPAQ
jgi:hypothetical protein